MKTKKRKIKTEKKKDEDKKEKSEDETEIGGKICFIKLKNIY